ELGLLLELGFHRDVLHDRVAARACEVAHLVRAALPEDPLALRVTGEAHRVTLLDGRLVVLRERDHPADAPAASRVGVLLARTVAVLAAEALARVAGLVQEEPAHLGVRELLVLFRVTALAGLRAGVTGGQRRGRRLGRLLGGCGRRHADERERQREGGDGTGG